MSERVCDFSVRLQGPAEAVASVWMWMTCDCDRVCVQGCWVGVRGATLGGWLAGSGAQNG